MLSLDVESLFTKVPVDDVLDFLKTKLLEYQDDLPLPVSKIVALIKLCVSSNYFSFQDEFYRQKFGCSMGSSLSPVLSNLYMEYFESIILPQIKPPSMVWYRYFDDIFTVWDESWGLFDDFLNRLNSLVPSIKFKVEWEEDGKLPFLDVMIIRGTGTLDFTVYRKPTHSGNYLHFFSNHSDKIKRSVASGLFLRALRICSPSYLQQELDIINGQLSKLGYPDWFLCKALSVAKANFYNMSPINSNISDTNRQKWLKIPYSKDVETLSKQLPMDDMKIIFNHPNSIFRKLVNVAQKVQENDKPGVYKIPCNQCDKAYYGQTGRNLTTRLVEHKRAIKYAQVNSAVFQHVSTEDHTMNWQEASILYKSECSFKIKIVESILISNKPNFNISQGQWTPDPITLAASKRLMHQVTSNPPTLAQGAGRVT